MFKVLEMLVFPELRVEKWSVKKYRFLKVHLYDAEFYLSSVQISFHCHRNVHNQNFKRHYEANRCNIC